jgi:selenocysteine-specific elongation factor
MVSGSLSVGETVQILPSGMQGKVRNLQVYNQPVEKAVAGQRTAVNLQAIETSAIERGDVLVRPQTFKPTRLIDAYLEHLPNSSRPLKHRSNLRFHIGTSVTLASVFLLHQEELLPGKGAFAQIRLVACGDTTRRFVIRVVSATRTVGGGGVIDKHPPKQTRLSPPTTEDLVMLRDGSGEQVLGQHILRSGMNGIGLQDLVGRVAMSPKEIQASLEKMIKRGNVLLVDPERMKVMDIGRYERLREMALVQLREFHERFPMKSGLAKEEFRTKLPMEVDIKLFQILLSSLIQSKHLVAEKDKLRLSEHHVSSIDEKGLIRRVESAVLKAGLQPPSPKELAEAWSEKEAEILAVFEHLSHEGVLVRIRSGLYFHRDPFEKLKADLLGYLKTHQEITTPQFKEMTGVSRKFAIPLIEYFDEIKLTIRLGEKSAESRLFQAPSSGQ